MSLLKSKCKNCGKQRTFDAEKCQPKAKATFPDGTVKEWTINCSPTKAVYVCKCGSWGLAK